MKANFYCTALVVSLSILFNSQINRLEIRSKIWLTLKTSLFVVVDNGYGSNLLLYGSISLK